MARLTRTQIQQIKKIIDDHMNVVMHLTTGDGKPSPSLLRKLKLPKSVTDLITNSYQYGRLGVLKDQDLSGMSESEINQMMHQLKLTDQQQRSIDQSKLKAQQAIDNLQQKVTSNTITAAIQSDLAMWDAVKDVVPAAIKNNSPRYKVIQELREKTKDMYRDWHRVVQTEMWSAKCQGEVESVLHGESPLTNKKAETVVYVKPAHNACAKCIQLYLESDKVTPRKFLLSELLANGSNYGKKQADWKATVPCLHPNCQCVINVMPNDTEFDAQGNLVYKPNSAKNQK